MELRKIRDAEDARACLAAVAASGVSRGKWARENGVRPRSLQAWWLNLTRVPKRRRGRAPLRVVEVTPKSTSPSAYVIVLGPFRVEVDDHFDAGTLRRLLGVIRAC